MRRKAVYVSGELFLVIFTEGWRVGDEGIVICEKGLPEGASFVSAKIDPQLNMLALIFEHPDWDDVAVDEPLPVVEIVHRYVEREVDDEVSASDG
jgi:hypothetical protein